MTSGRPSSDSSSRPWSYPTVSVANGNARPSTDTSTSCTVFRRLELDSIVKLKEMRKQRERTEELQWAAASQQDQVGYISVTPLVCQRE